MNRERWQRVKDLYNSVLELGPEKRDAFLREACAGDEEMRVEIERLLARQPEAEGFIESPALHVAARALAAGPAETSRLAEIRAPDLAVDPGNILDPDLSGISLGHYRVLERIGAGGTGIVYRAEDTHLDRQVAIKVLPDIFSGDPERLARFEREAKLLASLNHPNIAAIYGLEEANGKRFLVLELVEGETLAQRIAKGPLPLEEALEVCRQIAEGVEAAHEKGIIHRDLKPANVKITPEGKIKVLDFGLAKAFHDEVTQAELSHSPAVTEAMTREGVILGTVAYMSPEQANGKSVDKRTDIWAFGCIMFECLTGKRAFVGETVTETLASILKGEPNWQLLPAAISWRMRELLRHCFGKDPKSRLRDIGDARIEIGDSVLGPTPATAKRTDWRMATGLALVGLVLGAAIAALIFRSPSSSESKHVVRTQTGIGPAKTLAGAFRPIRTALAVSPDGKSLVFGGIGEKGPQLFLRGLDKWEAVLIAGTEGGYDPFLSPDGQWVGFWAGGQLKKVMVSGGTPSPLCDLPDRAWGASWGTNGTIVICDRTQLLTVPEAGGQPEVLIKPDMAKGEFAYLLPHVLPGGEAVLFSTQISPSRWDNPRIEVISLKTGARQILLEEGADARYADSGHIIFIRQGMLCAVAFDLSQLAVTGAPVQLIADVMQAANERNAAFNTFGAQFACSSSGTLAYVTGGPYPDLDRWLAWIDAKGTAKPVLSSTGPYLAPRVSPDGKRIAYQTLGKKKEIFVADRERAVPMPLTFGDQNNFPLWTPDGQRVTFSRQEKSGRWKIMWIPADGSGEAETLVEDERTLFASSWSPGDQLAYLRRDPTTNYDIWVFRIKDRKSEEFLNSPYDEWYAEFSPDGRRLAYVSNENGQAEVYVQSYPDHSGKIKISNGGGTAPCWRSDGGLYFRNGSRIMVVDPAPGSTFGAVRELPDYYGYGYNGTPIRGYDLDPLDTDGSRFLATANLIGGRPLLRTEIPDPFQQALQTSDPEDLTKFVQWLGSDPERKISPSLEWQLLEPAMVRINIVQNWFEELKRLCPTGKK